MLLDENTSDCGDPLAQDLNLDTGSLSIISTSLKKYHSPIVPVRLLEGDREIHNDHDEMASIATKKRSKINFITK